ncbi:hypothetical protein ACYJ1Y_16695 [Natrialbaceae archaeon A-gly3]
MPSTPNHDLEGRLVVLPELRGDLLSVITEEYAGLADAYGPQNVLVLKRHPAGLERVREALASAEVTNGTPLSPRLESLPEHASKVLEEYDPTLDRLAYEERIEIVSTVIAGASQEMPTYLDRAQAQETFVRDVGQLLLEATRQRIHRRDLEDPHDCLEFLYAVNDRFHEELEARGFIERADVIPRAVSLLAEDVDGLASRVGDSFDAVLALEFEECRRLDRRYLAALTREAELVCLGERHASVERTRVETGNLEDIAGQRPADSRVTEPRDDIAGGLEVEYRERGPGDDEATGPPHQAVVDLLATGRTEREGSARRIRAGTAREGTRRVATEIETLLDRHGWTYDDVAVAVPSVDRVPVVRDLLRNAGVPTAEVGTHALESDPAVNELYAVIAYNCDHDRELARRRLEARVPEFTPDLLEECTGSRVSRSLERWIVRTDLKGRLVEEETWIDARESFAGIERVLEIARFVESTDVVAADWEGLRRMLARTIEYDAPYVHAVETRPEGGGVAVCPTSELKYDSREAVFLLDLVDTQYPGEKHLTALFPTAWLEEMPTFPAVTDPTPEAVELTFEPASSDSVAGNPFQAYHAQRARRKLALGARAARSALYLCSYERETGGLGRTREESRYLKRLEGHPGIDLVDVANHSSEGVIHGRSRAIEALLDQPRDELEAVLREANTGGDADLGETEALFEEIALVLEDGDVDDDLAEAVYTSFEFAAGEVIRDE